MSIADEPNPKARSGVTQPAPQTSQKRKASDEDDVDVVTKAKRERVRRRRCACPCAEPENLLQLVRDIREEEVQCSCTLCGPLDKNQRRCTIMLHPAGAFIGLAVLCEDCRDNCQLS